MYIDGSWRFIDCHWGARHVTNTHTPDADDICKFRYELDEFFFLTDPEDMILMHFPDDPKWQMLEKTYSIDDFIKTPVVKSYFFHYGIKFGAKLNSVIDTDSGKVEVVLKRTGQVPLAFNTRLEGEDEILEGYCIHHYQNKEVIFNLSLPRRGVFYFTVFACDTDKSDAYNNLCSFRIKCTKVEDRPFCQFPRLPDGYGPTALAEKLGLCAEKYNEYYLVCMDEKMVLNIKFKVPAKVSYKLMMTGPDLALVELDRMVFERYRDQCYVSYMIRFPQRGIYVFSIFAAHRDSSSTMIECACRYLIQCNAKPSTAVRTYPVCQQKWNRARLHEPTCGDLKIDKNVKFKLEVAVADAVAVIVNNQWYYLKRQEDGKTWEGVAFTGRQADITADVYARFGSDTRDFFPMLEYRVISD